VANDSDTCESLKEDLKSDQDELNALIRRAPFVTDPDERRLLAEEMSRLRQEIRELQHAISIACRPPPPPPNVSITGVEQTQATQFFKSLLSPCPDRPGQAPCVDNDIPLVAGKATVFRVYTNVLAHPTVPITALTGVLEARPAGSTGLPVGLTPYNGPQPPRLQSQISRKNVNDALNFRLPAAMCHGQVEARLNVYDALHPGESGYTSQSFLRTLSFVETATLKIRLVRIHYKNAARAMDIPAPTTADFWTTAQYTLKTYPIPGIDVVRDTVELYDGDFTSFFASAGPGAQGTTGTIFDILTNLRNAESFPGDVHYLAIIPGFPANHTGASGWAISRRQIVEVLNGPAMAQEIGHDSGFPHHAPGLRCWGSRSELSRLRLVSERQHWRVRIRRHRLRRLRSGRNGRLHELLSEPVGVAVRIPWAVEHVSERGSPRWEFRAAKSGPSDGRLFRLQQWKGQQLSARISRCRPRVASQRRGNPLCDRAAR